jgi:uncharacterized damage-inducible protein DinB
VLPVVSREVLSLAPAADEPEVGRWLSALDEARNRTLHELDGIVDGALGERPRRADNSIGTLLYHLALIEADWLYADILEIDDPPPMLRRLLPIDDRDLEGHLSEVGSMTLDEHLDRLASVRRLVHEHLRPMDGEDFHRPRARPDYDVSPAWVLHHLLQHEAEHRAQIAWVREELRS